MSKARKGLIFVVIVAVVFILADLATSRAHDGEEGLTMAESEHPDIILLDMLMPKMHGIQFLEKYDVRNNHPGTKIIVFSNMDSNDLQKQALELGATKYEVKSRFSPNELAALVNQTLASRDKPSL